MFNIWWGDQNTLKQVENKPSKDLDRKVERLNNHIYFYSDVCSDSILALNKLIRETNLSLKREALNLDSKEIGNIYLHVSSFGGYVFDGFNGMDNIIKSDIPITTIIEGAVASAATYLTIVGKKRLMGQHSFLLIHQISSGFGGKFEEMKDHVENQKRLMECLIDIYLKKTKMKKEKIEDLLKHDLWLSPAECLEYGFIDQIV